VVQQAPINDLFLLNLFFLKFSLLSCKIISFQWSSRKSFQFPYIVLAEERSLLVPSGSCRQQVGARGHCREGGRCRAEGAGATWRVRGWSSPLELHHQVIPSSFYLPQPIAFLSAVEHGSIFSWHLLQQRNSYIYWLSAKVKRREVVDTSKVTPPETSADGFSSCIAKPIFPVLQRCWTSLPG